MFYHPQARPAHNYTKTIVYKTARIPDIQDDIAIIKGSPLYGRNKATSKYVLTFVDTNNKLRTYNTVKEVAFKTTTNKQHIKLHYLNNKLDHIEVFEKEG